MNRLAPFARQIAVALLVLLVVLPLAALASPPVYVVLWFDTEDYLLPASDDAALHIANFLTDLHIRGTFKVVGEKARTLERRGRTDVIEALKKHDIGYHSNFHSVHPTPAEYLNAYGWDDGVAEFDRRERPGFDDVKRIFGRAPSCYGQPGSSWASQTLGGMQRWGMKVYLDAGKHVAVNGKPFYYCGLLNIYQIANMPRTSLKDPTDLEETENKFAAARQQLQAEGGGLVSIIYHPCEFAHKEFWDGVNFRNGANPPRAQWKIPPAKTPEETRVAFESFESYIRYLRHFDDVQFITATDAVRLYDDAARGRSFTIDDIKTMAAAVGEEPSFFEQPEYTLSAAEVLSILTQYVSGAASAATPVKIAYPGSPLGPSSPAVSLADPVSVSSEQFLRTAKDLAKAVVTEGRVPPAVWFGSQAVPPESYLRTLGKVAGRLARGEALPDTIEFQPTKLAAAKYVADDALGLWKWVIFPANFHAPHVMEVAKREAWSLKPALLSKTFSATAKPAPAQQ